MANLTGVKERRLGSTFVTVALTVLVCGSLGACASQTLPSADPPIGSNIALVGETRNQRSLAHYEWYLFAGADRRQKFGAGDPLLKGKPKYHHIPAGRHTLFVRVLGTAERGLPGLRDGVVSFENVELDAGRAYVINGSRAGEAFDVWIEDEQTKEHITTAIRIRPKRMGLLW